MLSNHLKAEQFHHADALFSLMFTWLSSRLKERECNVLSILLNYIMKERDNVVPKSGYTKPLIPLSPHDFKTYYGNGKYSIYSFVPRPTVQSLTNQHVFIPPSECFRDLMGHGHRVCPLSKLDKGSYHSQSPRGQQLLNAAIDLHGSTPDGDVAAIVGQGYMWADDFDPNNVKGNRSNCVAVFITFALSQKYIHSTSNSYLIGLGPGNQSHEELLAKIGEDLRLLVSKDAPKMYHAQWGKSVPVFCPIYAFIADRPAKSKLTHTLAGNSKHHACFGISGNLMYLRDVIPSCTGCFQRRLENVFVPSGTVSCGNCSDWNLVGLSYPAPEDYPFIQSDDSPPGDIEQPKMLLVKEVTFESMIAAMKTAFVQYAKTSADGGWNAKQSKAFLDTECIDGEWQKLLAKASKELADRIAECRRLGVIEPAIEESGTPIPPVLSYPYLDMYVLICGLMHQIFLGLTKAFFSELLASWLKTMKKHASFLRQFQQKMLHIRRLKLSHSKCESINVEKGSFGKYVSENWIPIARYSKWICADLDSYEASDVGYRDPLQKTVDEYNKTEAKAWLKARRLDHNKDDDLETLQGLINDSIGQYPASNGHPIYIEEMK
jgi:hypothetical protein